jgi:dienelactone hydrolase
MMKIPIWLTGLILFLRISAKAQDSSLPMDAIAGKYETGYQTIWIEDYSRTWGSGPRPIRINAWYPAEQGGARMLFEQYVFPQTPKGFEQYSQIMVRRDIGDSSRSLHGLFKGASREFDKLLQSASLSIENAPHAKGPFPVVIYSLGQDDYSQENTILCELLASHGYIVLSVPQMGVSPRKSTLMIDEEQSFNAQTRDLQYAIAEAYHFPEADVSKIGCIGMSMGAVYGLLTAFQNNNIRLLIGLDPSYLYSYESYGYKYWQSPFYDEWNLKIPIVSLYRDDPQVNDEMIRKLKFSNRHLIKFPNLVHADFTSYPIYTLLTPPTELDDYALKHRSQKEAANGYSLICKTVIHSLDRYLKGDSSIVIAAHNDDFLKGIQCPSEEEFAAIIQDQGTEAACQVFEAARNKYPNDTLIRQKKIRRIGFEFYLDGDIKDAIGIYTLYTKAYPATADAWSNRGEMYMLEREMEKAKLDFQHAIELDPGDTEAKKMLDKINQSHSTPPL